MNFCPIFSGIQWGTDIEESGLDLAKWLERLAAKADVATVLFDPSILRHSGIWGADEAVFNTVQYIVKKSKRLPLFKKITCDIGGHYREGVD